MRHANVLFLLAALVTIPVVTAGAESEVETIIRRNQQLFSDVWREDDLAVKCHDGSGIAARQSDPSMRDICNALNDQSLVVMGDLKSLPALGLPWALQDLWLGSQLDDCSQARRAGNDTEADTCIRGNRTHAGISHARNLSI